MDEAADESSSSFGSCNPCLTTQCNLNLFRSSTCGKPPAYSRFPLLPHLPAAPVKLPTWRCPRNTDRTRVRARGSVRTRGRRLLTANRTQTRPLVRGLTPGSLGWCLTLPEYQPRPGTTGAPATGPTTPRHADRTPDEPTTERRHDGDDGAGAGRTRGRNRAFRSTE